MPSTLGVHRSGSAASTRGRGGDAFGDLFSGSTTDAYGATNITMTARRLWRSSRNYSQTLDEGRMWLAEGLDSLGGLSIAGRSARNQKEEEDNVWCSSDCRAGSRSASGVAQPRRNPRRSYCFIESFNHEGSQPPSGTS